MAVNARQLGIKIHGSTKVRIWYNEDGSPVRRKAPKEKMSKKERRKLRREKHDDNI